MQYAHVRATHIAVLRAARIIYHRTHLHKSEALTWMQYNYLKDIYLVYTRNDHRQQYTKMSFILKFHG